MSWSAWPTAGPPLPGVVAAPAMQTAVLPGTVNSAPAVLQPAAAAAIPAGMQYSPEQWAQMQQQNWQQWAQWQQQYQQWHQQYGAEYQKSINALSVAAAAPAPVAVPAANTAVPPPPPNENKPPPPPPPDDAAAQSGQPGQYNTMPPKIGGGYTTMPPNQQYTTGPPPNFRQQPQNQWQNVSNKRTLSQSEDFDGGKRQMLDNQGQWSKPNQPPKAAGQQWQSQPPPSAQTHAQKVLNLEELTVAEKKFDKEFAAWEAQFNKWKKQNANHPDKTQYLEYEKKWESWRNSLLERREQMRKKRVALQASMATNPPPNKPAPVVQPLQQSFSQPPPTNPAALENQTPAVDLFSKPPPTQNNEPLSFKQSKGYPGEEIHAQEGEEDFLKSSTPTSGGIPGLDLVKEDQNPDPPEEEVVATVEDTTTPAPAVSKGPDLDAISKGINTILGDPKLMNMLSMVSQNQSFAVEKPVTTQPPPPPSAAPKSNQPIPSLLSLPLQSRPVMDQSNQSYEDYSDQYGSGQRETVNNFDDQTRMSFSNGPNDQDVGFGNNFNNGPPGGGRLGRMDSFPRGDRDNFGGNFNDNKRERLDRFNSFEGTPDNRQGNNDNLGGNFNNRPFNRNDNVNNRVDNFNNRNDNFNNRNDNFTNRNDNFNGRNDNFNNRNDNFNNRNGNFNNRNNRGGQFNRNNDYDNYGDDYEDRFNDNYDDYHQGYDNQRGFKDQKDYGDDYNEERWNEDDEYEKYHDMFTEDQSNEVQPVVAPPAAVPSLMSQSAVPPLMSQSAMPPLMSQSEQVAPPVEDGPLFVPEVVVDYEHKTIKEPEPEISLDPIYMFDYRHKPVNRIPYPQRPPWLQGTLKNTRQFDPLGGGRLSGVDRQFDPLGAVKLASNSRRLERDYTRDRYLPEDKYERRSTFENRSIKSKDDRYREPERDRYIDNRFERRPEKDRDYGRDRENRYEPGPRSRDREFRDREYDDRSKNRRSQERKPQYQEKKLDLEELSDDEWNDDDNNTIKTSEKKETLRFSPPQRDTGSPEISLATNPSNPSVNAPVNQNVTLEDLINSPGRYKRPPRIVIILRGPPGSGKTYLARLIKDREVENGGSAPRILSLDDYFMVEQEKEIIEDGKAVRIKEMVYEYEAEMEESYRQSLTKAFKKTVTDGYFNFIVVDNVNQKVKYFGEMWSFAKQNGFQVYICQLDLDPQLCTRRNIHNRSQADIEDCIAEWEPTPSHHPLVDATSFLQSSGPITEVEMEEVDQPSEDRDEAAEDQVRSKWDTFDCSVNNLARLDGVSKPLRHSRTMEEYLQLDDEWEEPSEPTKPGQKRVRWADLEEQRQQKKMKAIGFVVGQTDWKRMMDPTSGGSALTQTKYIERVRRS